MFGKEALPIIEKLYGKPKEGTLKFPKFSEARKGCHNMFRLSNEAFYDIFLLEKLQEGLYGLRCQGLCSKIIITFEAEMNDINEYWRGLFEADEWKDRNLEL